MGETPFNHVIGAEVAKSVFRGRSATSLFPACLYSHNQPAEQSVFIGSWGVGDREHSHVQFKMNQTACLWTLSTSSRVIAFQNLFYILLWFINITIHTNNTV